MIRHIELKLEFDLTCGGYAEDFENDNDKTIKDAISDYFGSDASHFIIKKVWYEKEEGE